MIKLKTEDWVIENIDTVLFDKDGTLLDLHFFWGKMTELRCQEIIRVYSFDENLFKKLCLELGYDINSGMMLSDGITALYSRAVIIDIFRERLLNYGIHASISELTDIFDTVSDKFYKNMLDYTKPIDSAISFVKKLNNYGVKLGIVTSDSLISTNLALKNFNWEALFQSVVGRESSSETKECGALTKIALKELGAIPKTTIMIGDAPMDYISANNSEIEKTILVSTGQISKKELRLISPYVVDSLDEIDIIV